MSAKEIVLDLIRQLPDDAWIDVIAHEVIRVAAAQDESTHSSAGLPVFAVSSNASVIPGTRANQILAEEPTCASPDALCRLGRCSPFQFEMRRLEPSSHRSSFQP